MQNYTLVYYRSDHTDRCGDTTGSDFEILCTPELPAIVNLLADVLYYERRPSRDVYADYEFHFLINGVVQTGGAGFKAIYDQASVIAQLRIGREAAEKEARERAKADAKVQQEAERKALQ